MKIFEEKPVQLIRLMISRQGDFTKYINLCECTMDDVLIMVNYLISMQTISPFTSGKKVSVVVREALGGNNGKSKSISFRGMSTNEVHKLITEYVKTHPNE